MFNDFATGDKGGDIIDLFQYVRKCGSKKEAAEMLISEFPFLVGGNIKSPVPNSNTNKIPAKKEKSNLVSFMWNNSFVSEHSYLDRKGIKIGNARVILYKEQKQLLVPLVSKICDNLEKLSIENIQTIDEKGEKRFINKTKGLFHIASDYALSKDKIVISEGYATARSVAEATGLYVVAAMSANNLKNVAHSIKAQFPKSMLILAGENDDASRNAIAEVLRTDSSIKVVYPDSEYDDFNDMCVEVGTEAINAIFENIKISDDEKKRSKFTMDEVLEFEVSKENGVAR